MAKKMFISKALVNITHSGVTYKIGDTLKISEDDANELKNLGYVEIIEKPVERAKGENDDVAPDAIEANGAKGAKGAKGSKDTKDDKVADDKVENDADVVEVTIKGGE